MEKLNLNVTVLKSEKVSSLLKSENVTELVNEYDKLAKDFKNSEIELTFNLVGENIDSVDWEEFSEFTNMIQNEFMK